MLYAETRDKIRSGDVLAWTHTKWNSWYNFKVQMVRVFTQSEYCHVGVAWVIGKRVFVFEAVSAGVRMYPLSSATPFYWIPTSRSWNDEAEEFALSQIGMPYSQLAAMEAFLGENDEGKDGTWECAEYVKVILKYLGIKLPGKATPSDVVKDLQALGLPVYLVN